MADPQKALVTGASGFLGKHVVLALLRAGWQVRGSLRDPGRGDEVRRAVAPHLPPEAMARLSFVVLDLLGDAGWSDAASGMDALVHTASPFPIALPKHPDDLIRPAVEGTRRALAAARDAGIRRVVLTSSVAAILGGDRPAGHGPHDEGDWSVPDVDKIGAYATSKTLAERAAWDFIRDHAPDIALTAINPSMIFGPPLDAAFGDSIGLLQRILAGRDPMTPRMEMAIVDVRDVALAHLRALERPQSAGQRIIVSAGTLSFADMGRILKNAYPKRRIATRVAPDILIRLIGLFSPAIRTAAKSLGVSVQVSNARARAVLGMDFIAPDAAVLAGARWLVDHDAA